MDASLSSVSFNNGVALTLRPLFNISEPSLVSSVGHSYARTVRLLYVTRFILLIWKWRLRGCLKSEQPFNEALNRVWLVSYSSTTAWFTPSSTVMSSPRRLLKATCYRRNRSRSRSTAPAMWLVMHFDLMCIDSVAASVWSDGDSGQDIIWRFWSEWNPTVGTFSSDSWYGLKLFFIQIPYTVEAKDDDLRACCAFQSQNCDFPSLNILRGPEHFQYLLD